MVILNAKQIRYADTLSRLGSFSLAAEELGISQPSLSQYIKKLEQELGLSLFERAEGAVRTTDAGNAFLETGRRMLALEEDLSERLRDIANQEVGTLCVGTTPFRSLTLLPTVAKKFSALHPNIRLIISEMTSTELVERAEHAGFDLFVTTLPLDTRKFSYEVLFEEEIVLAVAKDSETDMRLKDHAQALAARAFAAIDLNLMKDEKFVKLTEYQLMQQELEKLEEICALEFPTSVVVKSLSAQAEMVAAGVGCALVPMGVKHSLRTKNLLSYYSLKQDTARRALVAAWRKNKYVSRPLSDLIEVLKSN